MINNPTVEALTNRYYRSLLDSKFRPALEKKWGNQLFVIAELSLKTFQPTILEDLKEENKLTSEYVKIKASAEIEFRGEKYTLPTLLPHEISKDRQTRKGGIYCQMGILC